MLGLPDRLPQAARAVLGAAGHDQGLRGEDRVVGEPRALDLGDALLELVHRLCPDRRLEP